MGYAGWVTVQPPLIENAGLGLSSMRDKVLLEMLG